jgi:hypothetical protein
MGIIDAYTYRLGSVQNVAMGVKMGWQDSGERERVNGKAEAGSLYACGAAVVQFPSYH